MTGQVPGSGSPQSGDEVCVLVSASCTIAWADQNRGALWLCPSGVLRVPLDPQAIASLGAGPTVDPNMPWEATFTRAQFDDAARLGGGFRWHHRTDIASARFEPGQTSNALHLGLRDRNRVKFLWLAVDGGRELIDEWVAAGTP
jgi:hypothetical protein